MSTLMCDFTEAIAPTPEESVLAQESSRSIARFIASKSEKPVQLRIHIDDSEESISIPASALRMLNEILTQMAKGNAITLIPIHAELTTQQSADILNVSRQFLVEQLEQGIIPFQISGKHRRILFADLLKYKDEIDRNRLAALDELVAQAQELQLGY